ncbi:aldose-1-epimerase [Atlantibacter sp.]|uniref:aldose-1-epimerase n=1 Tax=Atlantibacter sp. TaxID=1903473 RepID=UPI0028AAAEB6|nr:aldose-1-epimerase [Atlantibacter sp.]
MREAIMQKSGKTLVLCAGDYQAKIVTVGAGIAELTHRGRHLVIPHHPDEMPLAHLGKVLVPWPNRITNGCYRHDGVEYQLAINDRASQSAIHGLLAWREWQIDDCSETTATLSVFLPPHYGYPFMLMTAIRYQLDAETGLSGSIKTTNLGDVAAPYGAGIHPYLTCNLASTDSCELTLPFIDAVPPALDYRRSRKIGDAQIDHTFKTVGNEWEVRLTSREQRMTAWLRSDQPWLQIYTADKLNRKGLAAEPMSCPPDAFNSGQDVVLLAPGASHRFSFTLGGE